MIGLFEASGLHASVDPVTAELRLSEDLQAEEVAVRMLDAARGVYFDPPAEAEALYYMLNGITHRARPDPNSVLRLELTALRGGNVGPEWVKTIGHVHDEAPDGLGYPEVYEVVAGNATFVLFRAETIRHRPRGDRADPVVCVLVDAQPGERFVIPPGWHHLATNSGEAAMVFVDVVARAVVPDYSLLRERRGAPLYAGPSGLWRNRTFTSGAVVRVRCSELPLPRRHGRLAETFLTERDALEYLIAPARSTDAWSAFAEITEAAPRRRLEDLALAPTYPV